MEVRHRDDVDFGRVNASRFEIVAEPPGRRGELCTRAGVEHDRLAAGLHDRHCERDVDRIFVLASSLEGSFGLVDRGVLDEASVERPLVEAVVDHRHFDVANLEGMERLEILRLFGLSSRVESNRPIEAEHGRSSGCANHSGPARHCSSRNCSGGNGSRGIVGHVVSSGC